MNTLRLPQYSIDTSGMRKSHSLEPLKPLNESRRDSSPLPNVLQTFANNFNNVKFDLLVPKSKSKTRSRSTETVFRDTDYNEKQENCQGTTQQQEQVARSQNGMNKRGATAKYLLSDWQDNGDIKLELEQEPVRYQRQRSTSLNAPMVSEDLHINGLVVSNDSKTHRSCVQLEKNEDDLCTLMEALHDTKLFQYKSV